MKPVYELDIPVLLVISQDFCEGSPSVSAANVKPSKVALSSFCVHVVELATEVCAASAVALASSAIEIAETGGLAVFLELLKASAASSAASVAIEIALVKPPEPSDSRELFSAVVASSVASSASVLASSATSLASSAIVMAALSPPGGVTPSCLTELSTASLALLIAAI